MSKNIERAFHPGIYLKDYLDELQMTQDEFAKRLGITGKQLSLILSEEANITADIAYKLSKLIGTSAELWMNLQTKYDTYLVEIKTSMLYEEEKKIFRMIDRKFLKQLNIINDEDNIDEAIDKLRTSIPVSSLLLLVENDIYSFCRTSVEKETTVENVVCKNLWISSGESIALIISPLPFIVHIIDGAVKLS
jgi:addiction module HigA family antidote